MTVLAVDLGSRNLGIALADGPLARPLATLAHISVPESCRRLVDLATTHQASLIVLGLPDGSIAKLAHSFQHELTKRTSIPVHLHPESLTTKDALAKLRAAGAKKSKLKNEHSYAACLILEDYLESNPGPS